MWFAALAVASNATAQFIAVTSDADLIAISSDFDGDHVLEADLDLGGFD
ncbi:hypothetical protein Poly30_43270 [Planctomycetes bacterium Poly30]|uniref:Uncharacterized protein n=1 Tax=Saltatorellus ferox TaxID=2528018 RepID=A0A518EXF0_9BACT|nr:hypothetical protein Poly30_43270 [Planctomycetes bacterium Poly30]